MGVASQDFFLDILGDVEGMHGDGGDKVEEYMISISVFGLRMSKCNFQFVQGFK